MSSVKLYARDLRRRIAYRRFLVKYIILKHLSHDFVLPFGLKKSAYSKLSISLRDRCLVRIRNRCVYTFRARSVYRKFRISRLQVREHVWRLLIPGMSMASW